MAFNTVYQKAVQFYRKLGRYQVTNEPEWVPLLMPLPMPELKEDDPARVTSEDVKPLLEMMTADEEQPQSEALILLENVITSTPSACKPILREIIKNIKTLLE